MNASVQHDPTNVPLDAGRLLIEASAGTGKTYALTTLVARLVVEYEQPIEDVLVVTFTNAATSELKDRVRTTLSESESLVRIRQQAHAAGGDSLHPADSHERLHAAAAQAPETQEQSGQEEDSQARTLVDRFESIGLDLEDIKKRLHQAVRNLDRAALMTIHSFCRRLLKDFAFNSGLPFNLNDREDGKADAQAAVRDYWRREFYGASPLLISHMLAHNLTPAATDWADALSRNPKLKVLGGCEIKAFNALRTKAHEAEQAWETTFKAAADRWKQNGETPRKQLNDLFEQGWSKRSLRQAEQRLDAVDSALTNGDLNPDAFKDGYFSPDGIEKRKLKSASVPKDPMFTHFKKLAQKAQALDRQHSELLRGHRHQLLKFVAEQLESRVWEDRQLSYDAQLTEVYKALQGPQAKDLAERIRRTFPYALIDEFQDTDAVQAEIYQSIYPLDAAGGGGGLFVVGDPKQSIYGFRGADVFAYLRAKRAVPAAYHLPLQRNYRATAAMVTAVNAIFSRPAPFLLPNMTYTPICSALPAAAGLVIKNDHGRCSPSPMQFRLFAADPAAVRNRGKWTGEKLQWSAAAQAAGEIVKLLNLANDGRALIDERPLVGGDIAVLVRNRKQGDAVAGALRERGVHSVEVSKDRVLDSREATEIERLMQALTTAETAYDAKSKLRGALAGDLFGLALGELSTLQDDDAVWDAWERRARQWRGIWEQAGVATLMRHLLHHEKDGHYGAQLLRHADGPRRMTNYLHCADQLRIAETDGRLSAQELLAWLCDSRARQADAPDSELRLESDEGLVKIVTIHSSKGLEFPVTFCPFAWHTTAARNKQGGLARYHGAQAEGWPEILHLAPDAEAMDQECIEQRSEELRLFYVALTRAKYLCVVTWARSTNSHKSPLAWLLHGPGTKAGDAKAPNNPDRRIQEVDAETLTAYDNWMKTLSAECWTSGLDDFFRKDKTACQVFKAENLPQGKHAAPAVLRPDAKPHKLKARTFNRPLHSIRQMTSYSALMQEVGAAQTPGQHERVETADHDQDAAADLQKFTELEQSSEATGATQPVAPQADAKGALNVFNYPRGIRAGNQLHGLLETRIREPDQDLREACQASLNQAGMNPQWAPVAQQLVENARNTALFESDGFRLAEVKDCVTEMEFHLPANGLDRTRLGKVLAEHGYGNPFTTGNATPVNGFLRGFIDLVARHQGRWYVIDYKSNWLGGDMKHYNASNIAASVNKHGYQLQYLLYLLALHRWLRLRLPDYDYQRHVGGALYLFLRGMDPARPGYSVCRDASSAACINALDACFAGETP